MRPIKKTKEVARQRAIEIAAQHNGVAIETAQRYTDSELQEVLNQVSPSHLMLKLSKQ